MSNEIETATTKSPEPNGFTAELHQTFKVLTPLFPQTIP
jgi:hypothetical protein